MSNKANQESICTNGTLNILQSPQGAENRVGTQMHADTSVEQKAHDLCTLEANSPSCTPPAEQQAAPKAAQGEPFQHRVQPWLLQCFGAEIAADTVERNHRFLEEALALLAKWGQSAQAAEPVAWLRNTTDPQPHAVTNLKYRSAVDAKAGVEYIPVFAAPQPTQARADGWTPGHEKLYVQHVLETGGVGDVDDLRTFIDKQMAANGGNK